MDTTEAAFGLAEMVDENMANAARVHAGRLCEKLGIDRLLVPMDAGVGSAIGFLRAPFSFEANRTRYMRLAELDSTMVTSILEDQRVEATGFVRS